jgi:uncharacterized protein (TIGR02285 family)
MQRRAALFGLGGSLLLQARSATQPALPVMRWQVRDMPPLFNYRDGRPPRQLEDLGDGVVEGFMRQLLPQLPQYRHEFVEATAARADAMVREGMTLCSMIHLHTPERLADRYFTPTYPILGQLQARVVVHRSQLARFAALGQPLSLSKLLQQESFTGMVSAGRSYGPGVDSLIRAPLDSGSLKSVVVMRHNSVLAMLLARRMDYSIDFAPQVNEYLRSVNAPGELVSLAILEAPPITQSYASCTRNEEGRRQIEAIDQAIRRIAQPAARAIWLQAWRGHTLDATSLAKYTRFYDQRARGGPQIE